MHARERFFPLKYIFAPCLFGSSAATMHNSIRRHLGKNNEYTENLDSKREK